MKASTLLFSCRGNAQGPSASPVLHKSESPELWCDGKASDMHKKTSKEPSGVAVPLLQPQALPRCERLCGVLQHPELVEQHHVENDQQHQTAKKAREQPIQEHFTAHCSPGTPGTMPRPLGRCLRPSPCCECGDLI